jgi:hypothetical protein
MAETPQTQAKMAFPPAPLPAPPPARPLLVTVVPSTMHTLVKYRLISASTNASISNLRENASA